MLAHLNCANSTKGVVSSHLRTGQVFKTSSEGQQDDLWICLSPSCDMVPGQKTSGWYGRVGEFLPFVAVELESCKLETALNSASQNIHLFLRIENDVKAFTFHPNGNLHASPSWEQMFAANQGQFADGTKAFTVHRCAATAGGLVTQSTQATVVGQLRYEYALNLLQRLSGVFSRVGLDFKASASSHPTKSAKSGQGSGT